MQQLPFWKRPWQWLKKQYEIPVHPRSTGDARNRAGGVDPPAESRLLLTRRVSVADAEAAAEIWGFRETYYCPKCKDYFVLAWHARSSPLVGQCKVVPQPEQLTDSDPGSVFCPQCNSDYSQYGKIPTPGLVEAGPEGARVLESFDYIFPEGASKQVNIFRIGEFEVERIVLFVVGEFPEEMDVREFAYAELHAAVLERDNSELDDLAQAGIPFHLVRMNEIVDETYWLAPVLRREFYHSGESRTQNFVTRGVANLRPPLRQALLCLVLSL